MNEAEFRDWVWDNYFGLGESGLWAAKLVVGHLRNNPETILTIEEIVGDIHTHGKAMYKKAPNNRIHALTYSGSVVLASLMGIDLPKT
jgi:hypothetical protein